VKGDIKSLEGYATAYCNQVNDRPDSRLRLRHLDHESLRLHFRPDRQPGVLLRTTDSMSGNRGVPIGNVESP
jgi:hypothetical protein